MKLRKLLILVGAALAGTAVYKAVLAPPGQPGDPSASDVYSSLTGPGSLMQAFQTAKEGEESRLAVPKSGGGIGTVGNPHATASGSSSAVVRQVPNDDLPLIAAAAKGDKDGVTARLEQRVKVDSRDGSNRTALMYASWAGHNDICARLVAAGASIRAEDTEGFNALDYAAGRGLVDTVSLLLKHAHARDEGNHMEYARVMRAVYENDTDLLPPGSRLGSVNRFNPDGQAPLYIAAGNGSPRMIEALLKRGARVTLANRDRRTPLHWAAWNNQAQSIALLVDKGSDLSLPDSTGNTALMLAAQNNSADAAKALLSKGADKYRANKQGKTASMIAEDSGFPELAKLLK